jgi:glc operon protein GlcG
MSATLRTIPATAALVLLLAAPATRADLPRQPVLPLATALNMVAACIQFAGVKQFAVSIVVRDAGGNVLASARMDGASLGSYEVALEKSRAAGIFRMPTAGFAKYAFDDKTGLPTGVAFMPGIVLVQGGLPITTASGAALGSIGVSGAPAPDDEACGQAGIDAVRAELK